MSTVLCAGGVLQGLDNALLVWLTSPPARCEGGLSSTARSARHQPLFYVGGCRGEMFSYGRNVDVGLLSSAELTVRVFRWRKRMIVRLPL